MQRSTKAVADSSGAIRRGPRFANWVLIVCVAFSCVWFLYAIFGHKPHLYQKLVPAIAAIFSLLILRARASVRTVAALIFVGLLGGLYSAELALGMIDPDIAKRHRIKKAAQQAGIPFDARTRLQVITDFRKHGVLAYPPFYPYLLLGSPPSIDGASTLPLSSVPNALTVSCNEGGQYLTFTTDERGFANPAGIWPKRRADIAIIGDSIAVGECVPPHDNIGYQLRERYPSTISLGSGGNGPLFELATLKEYLPSLSPKHVLWFFYEGNDMDDLELEKKSPILTRYLNREFSQELLPKQDEVSKVVAVFFEDSLKREQAGKKESLRERLAAFVVLKNVRLFLWSFMDTAFVLDRPRGDFNTLERVLQEAQRTVGEWRGQFTLVYLPAPFRYSGQFMFSRNRRKLLDHIHSEVLALGDKLRIPVIDATGAFPDLPASESAKNARFFYPYFAHYKPEGYHAVGRAILNGLSAQAPQPSEK